MSRVASALLLITVAVGGCNCGGGGGATDGGLADRRSDRAFSDGTIPFPDSATRTRCGTLGARCCGGGSAGDCEDGLACDDRNRICCAGAGGECLVSSECCDGLGCDPGTGRCVIDEGDSCTETSECVEGTICGVDGTCTEPDGCGAAGAACCPGDSCVLRSLECSDGTDSCIECGMECCDPPCGDTPEGGDCTDTRECVDGTICGASGTCVDPGGGDCGVENGECCSRDSCRSRRLVCNEATDRCEPCGREDGSPCCEGRRPCGDADDLVCSRGTCVEPRDCGRPGDECCAPDDACVFGADCDRDRDVCVDGSDPESDPTCGDEGQGCCRNDSCDTGAICEPLVTDSCVAIADIIDFVGEQLEDCGQLGELCCPFNGEDFSFFTCEGDLQCDFLFCSDACTPLSQECDSTSECCQGTDTLCERAPTTKRCCHPAGGQCDNSTDCCGRMTCGEDETCACQDMGQPCNDDPECCPIEDADGTTREQVCREGTCEPETPCAKIQSECSERGNDSECCRSVCGRVLWDEDPHCCVGEGSACQSNNDCCGHMDCGDEGSDQEGTCVCQAETELCFRDEECCDGLGCVLGQCAPVDGCGRVTDSCDTTADCCGILRCQDRNETSKACCGRQTDVCENDEDCCGAMTCNQTTARCEAREAGESCVGDANECAGMLVCCEEACALPGDCP